MTPYVIEIILLLHLDADHSHMDTEEIEGPHFSLKDENISYMVWQIVPA